MPGSGLSGLRAQGFGLIVFRVHDLDITAVRFRQFGTSVRSLGLTYQGLAS